MSAYRKEKQNCINMFVMKIVPKSSAPRSANIICSHLRYIRKMDRRIKAPICPWENHNLDRYQVSTDAPSMLMEVIRIFVSVVFEKEWDLYAMDVCAAFLQVEGFNKNIFVRPPREEGSNSVTWLLLAAAVGLLSRRPRQRVFCYRYS